LFNNSDTSKYLNCNLEIGTAIIPPILTQETNNENLIYTKYLEFCKGTEQLRDVSLFSRNVLDPHSL